MRAWGELVPRALRARRECGTSLRHRVDLSHVKFLMCVMSVSEQRDRLCKRFKMFKVVAGLWCVVVMLAVGCGDPTDREQDCTRNEYFDTNDQLCISCPVVSEPSCRAGCGFAIVNDERGCPSAQCDLSCSRCEQGQVWSEAQLTCVSITCADGEYFDAQAKACVRCTQDDAQSTCLGCECAQSGIERDARGCMQVVCSQCTTALDEQHEVVDGQCRLKSDSSGM